MVRGAILLALSLTAAVAAADWAPTSAPLLTKWAKEVKPDNAWAAYPRPQFKREKWRNLNGLWDLALPAPATSGSAEQQFDRQILVPFAVESALSGVGERTNHLTYRRHFTVPADWKDQRVLLHFDAVDWRTSVTLNGTLLKTTDGDEIHEGGYDRFSYDITDALTTAPRQELVVSVFDPTDKGDQPRGKQVTKSEGIWYTPTTGIWQTVWLEPVSKRGSLGRLKFTPNPEGIINIVSECKHSPDGAQVEISIKTEEGPVVVTMAPNEEVDVKISNPRRWSPEDPHLYEVEARLKADGEVIDTVSTYFGLRDIAIKEVGGVQRVLLNGKEIFQLGLLDQGYWPDGIMTAPTPEALVWDIDYTREMGFNMIRKHIKVEPDIWYHHCDKTGMLVWQDAVSGGATSEEFHRQFERDMHRMIDNHWNSPAIVLWVIFNEGWGQYDTERLTDEVKKKDPTRLVTNPSGWVDKGVGDMQDIHQYPGPGAPTIDPKRASVLGEFGGLGYFVEGHTWGGKLWGYQGTGSKEELWDRWSEVMTGLRYLRAAHGLCGAVYTQTTDVEIEANGLVTYDRAVKKLDSEQVRKVNQSIIAMAGMAVLAETALAANPPQWQYATAKPADDWATTVTESADWKTSAAGFGRLSKRVFGRVGTPLDAEEFWIRREIELPEGLNPRDISLMLCLANAGEVFINGVKAAERTQHTTGYVQIKLAEEAQAAIKPGKNVLAIHAKRSDSDPKAAHYADAGLVLCTK